MGVLDLRTRPISSARYGEGASTNVSGDRLEACAAAAIRGGPSGIRAGAKQHRLSAVADWRSLTGGPLTFALHVALRSHAADEIADHFIRITARRPFGVLQFVFTI